MSSPDFYAVRHELAATVLTPFVTTGTLHVAYPYRPISLSGVSPCAWLEEFGWRTLLPAAPFGQYDVAFAIILAVNRLAHATETAHAIFDNVRRDILNVITSPDIHYTSFEALIIPSGEFAPTTPDIIDGVQYLTCRIPVYAVNVSCN